MNDLFQIRMTPSMGRGVFALTDIQPQQKILKLKKSTFITYKVLCMHPFFGHLEQMIVEKQIDKKVAFALYMTFVNQHKNIQKIHSKAMICYLKQLPPTLHSLILWNFQQLEMIQDKNLVLQTNQKIKKVKAQFQIAIQYLMDIDQEPFIPDYHWSSDQQIEQIKQIQQIQEYQQVIQIKTVQIRQTQNKNKNSLELTHEQRSTQSEQIQSENIDFCQYKSLCSNIKFETFLYFYSIVESRRVYYVNQYDTKSQLGALIQYLELFNHSPDGQVQMKFQSIQTTTKILKDQQIFTNYGNYSNQKMLLIYGIVIDSVFQQSKNQCIEKGIKESYSSKNCKIPPFGKQVSEQRYLLAKRYNELYQKGLLSTSQISKQQSS